ncbi:AAA family ATPase [Bacillus sp. BRMEA1]|uniref:uridine kinase family protein n=1 Tax=Neobacillus endophyticus TaxID=2738405 RepID=UPI001562EA82|nr:AAA family ATPase [Neobacillus endophyticus]NRD76961.1 AAA family ATPase [Neobacillus endophyticus]
MAKLRTFDQLVKLINSFPKKRQTLIIGIDGCGGSGKSTLANRLKEECENVTVIHMDDFYKPSHHIMKAHPKDKPIGADYDWQRVLTQVLEPLRQNKEGNYQRYDWDLDRLAEWHLAPSGGIVIIEGVYAIRKEMENHCDIKIWVNTPRETRLARGLERDGQAARSIWEDNWMIAEDIYMKEQVPQERVDFIVNGTE